MTDPTRSTIGKLQWRGGNKVFRLAVNVILICLTLCIKIVCWSNEDFSTLSKSNDEQSTEAKSLKHSINPSLKYPDVGSFARAIGQSACLLKSDHIYFFAPESYEEESKIILPYLIKAYDALRDIVGVDTEYILVVYNFPKGHRDGWGGTSNCTLWYDDSNLRLNDQEEWKRHRIPHVCGYIEEMAHNFVSATKAQFGWEATGWSISAKVSALVAANPHYTEFLEQTRTEQAKTFQRYVALGFTFPPDIPSNLVDRIHAHLLWQCEQSYGPEFWKDFFKEVKKQKGALDDAVRLSDGDSIRNERYRITIDCFDRLPGFSFRQTLVQSGISLTVDVKSLHPTDPGWNRKLQ
jgi:hypothetical protein